MAFHIQIFSKLTSNRLASICIPLWKCLHEWIPVETVLLLLKLTSVNISCIWQLCSCVYQLRFGQLLRTSDLGEVRQMWELLHITQDSSTRAELPMEVTDVSGGGVLTCGMTLWCGYLLTALLVVVPILGSPCSLGFP